MSGLCDVGSKGARSHNTFRTLRYIVAMRIRDIFDKLRNIPRSNNKRRLPKGMPLSARGNSSISIYKPTEAADTRALPPQHPTLLFRPLVASPQTLLQVECRAAPTTCSRNGLEHISNNQSATFNGYACPTQKKPISSMAK